MFDIKKIESSRAATFNVDVGLDTSASVPTPVGFIIVGLNSPEFEKADLAVRAFNARSHAQRAVQKRVLDTTTEEGAMELTQMTQQQRWIYFRHCIKGWYGFQDEGQPAVFTSEAALNVLRARPMWAEVVAVAMENEANFTKG